MNRKSVGPGGILCLAVAAMLSSVAPALAKDELDVSKIEKILGTKGQSIRGERVLKFTLPRTDMTVVMQGVPVDPALGLSSTVGFQELHSGRIMLMADLVLFEDEVNPVIDICLGSGLAVTGLHTQFAGEEPRVYVLHIDGGGKGEDLARSVGIALQRVRDVRGANPRLIGTPVSELSIGKISHSAIEKIIGQSGQHGEGTVRFVVGRSGVKLSCGCAVSKEMQVKNWAAFAGGDDDAVVTGEIAAFDGELQSTLRGLRKAGINVVGIYTHLEGETPRVMFVSFNGRGPARELAKAIRAILDEQKKRS